MRFERYSFTAILILETLTSGGCSLTATRPVQEMANADIAIKAAKDLNADSLVPELFRGAQDNFFKAKRDYRLKNFENARNYALRATRLAETAEFEAYRLGGAAPEAAATKTSVEGGSPDPENALKNSSEPSPVDPQKPGGLTGPRALILFQPMGPTGNGFPKQEFKSTTPAQLPSTGSPPPFTGGGPSQLLNSRDTPPSILPDKGITNYDMRRYEKPAKVGGPIPDLDAKPFDDLYDRGGGPIKEMGHDANPVKDGLDEASFKDIEEMRAAPFETLGEPRTDQGSAQLKTETDQELRQNKDDNNP